MRSLFVIVAMIWLGAASVKAAALAVVMAVDVSDSVTAVSYVLQRDGIARAFEDPRLLKAVAAAPGGIEALVLEWSDPDKIAVTVGWTQITGRAKRRRLRRRGPRDEAQLARADRDRPGACRCRGAIQ